MKPWIIALSAMAMGFAANAQVSAPPTGAATATAVEPSPALPSEKSSTTTPDNSPYVSNPGLLEACESQLAAFGDKPCDIIFIGDSITAGWLGAGKSIWEKDYAPRKALDFGISGDKIQNVLWRLNNMDVQNLKPKVAVILIGTNNLGNTPHEIADGIKAVLANTQEAFSGVKIILVSILPNARAGDKMMQVNKIIRSFADDGTVYYLDLVPLMPPVSTTTPDGSTDTNWKGLSGDHLHPNATGYQIWADAMEPLLTKLLAGG